MGVSREVRGGNGGGVRDGGVVCKRCGWSGGGGMGLSGVGGEINFVAFVFFFFFKQKTAYEIYQCDWSSDVCSSDLE